jgi:predicted nucleotidyltransferase
VIIRELVTALASANIAYCIVGGVAVNLHGVRRRTYNVDLVVSPDTRTLNALRDTLDGLGLRCRELLDLERFADVATRRRLLVEQNKFAVTFYDPNDPTSEVEIVLSPPLSPDDLVRRSVSCTIGGTAVRVVALSDLIFIKRVSGRLHDADDVARLEQLQRERRRKRRGTRSHMS